MMAALVLWGLLYLFDAPPVSLAWLQTDPWLFLSLVLIQPVLEEMVSRGALQGWLIQKSWGTPCWIGFSAANMMTSIVFVLMHLFYHAPLMAVMVMVPSLVFGYFRDRYDGWLLPSIILHCFYNLGYFLLYAPA